MKVSVYYNLHKHLLSVRSMEGDTYGKVIDHKKSIVLKDVKFVVSEAGRQRVLKEKRKNVHAFVRGKVYKCDISKAGLKQVLVTYNPYKYNSFVVRESGEKIDSAEYVEIKNKEILAYIK